MRIQKRNGKAHCVPLVSSELPAVHSVVQQPERALAGWHGDSDLKTELHLIWDFTFCHLLQLSVSGDCSDRFACIKTYSWKVGWAEFSFLFALYREVSVCEGAHVYVVYVRVRGQPQGSFLSCHQLWFLRHHLSLWSSTHQFVWTGWPTCELGIF